MNSFVYLGITIVSLVVLFILQIVAFRKFGNAFVQNIGEGINELLGSTVVKRGMSIIAKQGGDTKAVNVIKNKLAKGFIEKNYGLIKIAAEKFGGIDVDELIDDYGAENILVAVQQFAPMIGFDLNSMMKALPGQGLNISQAVIYPKEE